MSKPRKWTEVYPYGTKEGDEEAKFFRTLARSKYEYRSVAQVVKSTGFTRERVEEIIDKYVNKVKPALIIQHDTNPEMWGYWENCKVADPKKDISKQDKDDRIDKHLKNNTP